MEKIGDVQPPPIHMHLFLLKLKDINASSLIPKRRQMMKLSSIMECYQLPAGDGHTLWIPPYCQWICLVVGRFLLHQRMETNQSTKHPSWTFQLVSLNLDASTIQFPTHYYVRFVSCAFIHANPSHIDYLILQQRGFNSTPH
jgi:hypothetical protein